MGADDLKDDDFGAERVVELRREVQEVIDRAGLSYGAVAREASVSASTVSAWMNGTYAGSMASIAVKLQRWVNGRRSRAQATSTLRRGPGFTFTPTAKAFTSVLEHAQHAPDLAVIVGAPGVGKTTTARQYASQVANVWLLTAEPCFGQPRAMLEYLAQVVGVSAPGVSGQRISRAIVDRISRTGGLIIVDEAQHLSSVTLDQLRTIHDLSDIGVTLLGNPSVYGRLDGGNRREHFAQLWSRIGMRVRRDGAQKGDIDALLDAWAVEDAEARAACRAVGLRGGALRSMTKVLRQAHLRLGNEGATLTQQHVLAAAQQLGVLPVEDAA